LTNSDLQKKAPQKITQRLSRRRFFTILVSLIKRAGCTDLIVGAGANEWQNILVYSACSVECMGAPDTRTILPTLHFPSAASKKQILLSSHAIQTDKSPHHRWHTARKEGRHAYLPTTLTRLNLLTIHCNVIWKISLWWKL